MVHGSTKIKTRKAKTIESNRCMPHHKPKRVRKTKVVEQKKKAKVSYYPSAMSLLLSCGILNLCLFKSAPLALILLFVTALCTWEE